jgi:hypothetical protein
MVRTGSVLRRYLHNTQKVPTNVELLTPQLLLCKLLHTEFIRVN